MSDELVTYAEDICVPEAPRKYWNVLVVDDEADVHRVTSLVLNKVNILGRSIRIFDCYTAAEAREFFKENEDIAVVLLDVVMEEDDAGLKLVKYIREQIKNRFVRIILRTGQPGQAPEEKIIVEYDINDYKSKTELASTKLFTAIVASIRSYNDLLIIEKSKRGLEMIIRSSAKIFEIQSMKQFVSGILVQLVSMLQFESDALYCYGSGITATVNDDSLYVVAGAGKYDCVPLDSKVEDALPSDVAELIKTAFVKKRTIVDNYQYVGYFRSKNGSDNVIYLEYSVKIEEWQRELIDIFSSNVSVAFDNIYLNQELESSQKEIIFTLGEIAEKRSRETQNHVLRVGEYCKFLGLKLGMSEEESELLKIASAMHDIGKLAVPDALLNKKGKLSDMEYEEVKLHATVGGNMFKHSKRNILMSSSIIAIQHHEKFDGSGYPMGLKGDDIHIYARITSVADVFDALTSDRVYRKALSIEQVLAKLNDLKGTHFDPEIADLLITNIDEILKIKEKIGN